MRSYQNSKRAEVGFARETRRGNLRGIPSPKSKRVSRTRIPTTSLVTSRKMGNRRFIPMEAALLHWLSPYRKEEGLLIPMVDSAVRRRMKKLRLASKVNPPPMPFVTRSFILAGAFKQRGTRRTLQTNGQSEAVCKTELPGNADSRRRCGLVQNSAF
jgi:hypothetical protein